ncbi:MAG: hypothetical protein PVI43_01070 [Candidatus Bathyarchaeota archaeon]|jgi:hypothetical protein
MKFPTMVYRCPGRHNAGNKQTYDFKGVKTQKEFDDLTSNGWYPTLREAKHPPDENAREELEAMAKELGVKFNARTSDKVLLERVKKANDELD